MQTNHHSLARVSTAAPTEPLWLKILLILSAYLIVGLLILVPLIYVFTEALKPGLGAFYTSITRDSVIMHSIWMTMIVAPVAVILNTIFGIAAAWTITKFKFPGRTFLISLLDIPFAVSPVVAGLMFVLLFGLQGYFGPFLKENNIKIIYAYPGLLLATCFVTMPFIARELIPLMQSIGKDEELAAVSLGANPWQLFWRITLPNIKWGLLYGIIQCNARAIGEFGAVSVVSARIEGQTFTMPLMVDKLFQDSRNAESFGVASLLTIMALATLLLKYILEQWIAAQNAARSKEVEESAG